VEFQGKMQNFTIPRPQANPYIANAGYGFAACIALGFVMFAILPASTAKAGSGFNPAAVIVPMLIFMLGGLGPFIRYWIFAKNPDDARRLPENEMSDIDQKMQGKWQMEYDIHQNGIQCFQSTQVQEADVNNGNYTYTIYTRNRGMQKLMRKLEFFRSPDGRLWFDNYGLQVYELDLPNRFVAMNYIGQDVTWNRTSEGIQTTNHQPVYNPPAHNSNPPAYNPSAPPIYDFGPQSGSVAPPVTTSAPTQSGSNSGGKSIGQQLRELNDLKDQGILSQSEFETAKAKVLA